MPKVALEKNSVLEFEFVLAKDLHMTHKQLTEQLDTGELAYWLAFYEREYERHQEARRKAGLDKD